MQNIKKLIKKKALDSKPPFIVAVDGRSGSGKTTFADLLAKSLDTEVVHTDDFSTADDPLNWYQAFIDTVLQPVVEGKKTLEYYAASDTDKTKLITHTVPDILIIEGVSSSRKEFCDYIDFAIFVETDKEEARVRGIARDISYGRTKEDATRVWDFWSSAEDGYEKRDNPKESADIVLDGARPFEEQVTL